MKRVVSLFIAIILGLILGPGGGVFAQTQPNAGTPLEVKKTVEAFLGHWVLTGMDTEPGAKAPVRFAITIDCKRAALGAAVNCGKLPGVGPIEAAAVIGYSPDERLVRWMEISSTGEYHDHKGRWKGDKIQFEPLTYSVGGKQATEYLNIRFSSPGQQALRSLTETAEGRSILEWSGKRSSLNTK